MMLCRRVLFPGVVFGSLAVMSVLADPLLADDSPPAKQGPADNRGVEEVGQAASQRGGAGDQSAPAAGSESKRRTRDERKSRLQELLTYFEAAGYPLKPDKGDRRGDKYIVETPIIKGYEGVLTIRQFSDRRPLVPPPDGPAFAAINVYNPYSHTLMFMPEFRPVTDQAQELGTRHLHCPVRQRLVALFLAFRAPPGKDDERRLSAIRRHFEKRGHPLVPADHLFKEVSKREHHYLIKEIDVPVGWGLFTSVILLPVTDDIDPARWYAHSSLCYHPIGKALLLHPILVPLPGNAELAAISRSDAILLERKVWKTVVPAFKAVPVPGPQPDSPSADGGP